MDFTKILWIAVSYMLAIGVAMSLHLQDETDAIPLIRPRGRPNPKLWAAVRKLMIKVSNPR